MLSRCYCLLLHIYVSLNVGQDLLRCLLSNLQRAFQMFFISYYEASRGAPVERNGTLAFWGTGMLSFSDVWVSLLHWLYKRQRAAIQRHRLTLPLDWGSWGLDRRLKSQNQLSRLWRSSGEQFCPQLLWLGWPSWGLLCSCVCHCFSCRYCRGSWCIICHLSLTLDCEFFERGDYIRIIFLSLTQDV